MSRNILELNLNWDDRGLKILLLGVISIAMYLLTLYILLQTPIVATFSGSEDVTKTDLFTVSKKYWDLKITYFKNWSPFWSLKVELYKEGEDEKPVFSTSVLKFTYPGGEEKADFNAHPNLPAGRYYLKVYSKSVQWTLQVVEWD